MTILGPNGLPARPQRSIPDEVLIQALQNHEERLSALGAQQIHLGIMVEYMTERLTNAFEQFEIDEEEFVAFRTRRWEEMQEEAKKVAKARKAALQAADHARRNPMTEEEIVDLDLNLDFDDIEESL